MMIFGHSLLEVGVFCALVIGCLWYDLHSHDDSKPVTAKSAAKWTAIWVSLAFAFAAYIGFTEGTDQMQLFIAGYLLEESLSVDNLFVMMAIFTSFGIKDAYQHRVLYYGILGAVIMRLLFVAAGSGLIKLFGPYALGAFGIFILWTAFKMFQSMNKHEEKEEVDYSKHWAVKWTQKFIPIHPQLHGHDFFVRTDENGVPAEAPKKSVEEVKVAEKPVGKLIWRATPLFLCLMVIELSDVMFAFDSVPAVLAITPDPFIVYTSNIFAILGLRSMFFLLAAAKRYLRHLEKSVIAILAFVGIKMLASIAIGLHVPAMVSLAVVVGFLAIGILASFLPEKKA